MDSIGKRLRAIRESLNLKQEELANILNSNQKSISRYEKNLTNISSDMVVKLVNNFKVNSNWLLTGQGEMFLAENQNVEVVKKIKGDNNNVAINQSNGDMNYINSNNSFGTPAGELDVKTILNGIKNIQDTSILQYFNI